MQYQKKDNNLMYAILFGVIFFMFILPEMNKSKCKSTTSENMSGWFDNAVHSVGSVASTVRSIVAPPGRCSNNCCNSALNNLPQYKLMNNTVCQGRGCVCLTQNEQDKLKRGALKVTDLL